METCCNAPADWLLCGSVRMHARAKKWDAEYKAKYGSPDNSESEDEVDAESEILDELLGIPRYERIFTKEVNDFIAAEHKYKDNFLDEKLENIDNLDSEINPDKEQVVFDNNEFAELDGAIDSNEPIGKNDEHFIEKDDELIEEINAIGL